jgi:iron(III) transport system permease protein
MQPLRFAPLYTTPMHLPENGLASLITFRGLSIVLAAVVAGLIVYPVGLMVVRAFVLGSGEASIREALAKSGVVPVLWNTVSVAVLAGSFAMVAGTLLAWLNQRTDAGTGWVGELLPLTPLLLPQLAGVIGWVMLFSPQAGLINGSLRYLLNWVGVEVQSGPFNIFTLTGFVLVMALYLTPYVYLPVSAALKSLDPYLEEASRMCRAGAFTTFRRITLLAIKPALAAAGLLVLMTAFSIFSVPIVIGTGANVEVLSVKIYRLVFVYPPRMDLAILLGLVLTGVVQILLLTQTVVLRRSRSATIGGKGLRAASVRLGKWRFAARGFLISYIALTSVLPLLGLLFVSFQPFWTSRINWSSLGLQNYATVFLKNEMILSALRNSIFLAAVGGMAGMLIAAILSSTAKQLKGGLGSAIDLISALPAGLPHIVIAVGFIFAFSSGALNISGTLSILLLAYLVINIPLAMRSASAAVAEVGTELIEASRVFKAGPMRRFTHVLLPLLVPGLTAGWIILFVQMSGELTASSLLAGTTNPVVGQIMIDLWQNGSFPEIAALAVVLTVIHMVMVSIVLRITRRRFS